VVTQDGPVLDGAEIAGGAGSDSLAEKAKMLVELTLRHSLAHVD
jgi:hypothetical protein